MGVQHHIRHRLLAPKHMMHFRLFVIRFFIASLASAVQLRRSFKTIPSIFSAMQVANVSIHGI